MNTTEDLPVQKPQSPTADSRDEAIRSLQKQVRVLLILLLIVSGTLTVYMKRASSRAKAELTLLNPQVQRIRDEFNSRGRPAIREFINRLGEYSQTHPEVVPIMHKHGLTNVSVSGPATGTGPAFPTTPAQ